MKRKSGRKVSKKEEESSNGVDIDSKSEQNGDTSDHDEDEAPKDKKRKSSKGSRKSVSFSSKKEEAAAESEKSDDQEDDNDPKEDKKRSKASRKTSKKEADESQESDEDEGEKNQEKKKPSKKRRKSIHKDEKPQESEEHDSDVDEKKKSKKGRKAAPKDDKGAQDSEDQDEDDESQYEVEAVLDEKMIKGVRHYLIRWKGYEEESDTWEPEDTLDCDRLIQVFKENKKKGGKPKKVKKELKAPDWDENEDFEVSKILEVHYSKNGKREFLVSWKGYGPKDNSWEPEENMDCKDLIAKFMAKVEKAREVDEKELRVNRPHVQRYTLSTQPSGRRLSKRFWGKERVQYHDAE